jgi:hypothetical protein
LCKGPCRDYFMDHMLVSSESSILLEKDA